MQLLKIAPTAPRGTSGLEGLRGHDRNITTFLGGPFHVLLCMYKAKTLNF